jgi:hypothetical protein
MLYPLSYEGISPLSSVFGVDLLPGCATGQPRQLPATTVGRAFVREAPRVRTRFMLDSVAPVAG